MANKARSKNKRGQNRPNPIQKKVTVKTVTRSATSKVGKNALLNISEGPISTSTPKKFPMNTNILSNRKLSNGGQFNNSDVKKNIFLPPSQRSLSIIAGEKEAMSHDSLFDSGGYVNSSILTYYRNQISDRIYSSDMIKEKMSYKIREIENQVKDFGKWIKLIDEIDYIKLDYSCPKSKLFVKQSEAHLNDIRDMLNEVDIFYAVIDQAMDDVECDRNFLRNLDLYIVSTVRGCPKWGKVTRGLNYYVLNSLSMTEQPAGARIMNFQKFCGAAECSPELVLFLDLKWNGSVQARIHLQAVDNDSMVSFSKLQRKLFQGDPPPVAKGSKLESLIFQNSSSSFGKQESSESSDILNDKIILIEATNFDCKFHLLSNVVGLDGSCMLEVTKGGFVLRQIMQSKFYKSVVIAECGIIMSDS